MKYIIDFLHIFAVPPSVPVIYNEQNEPIETRAGPYEESGQLILTCVVMGGKFTHLNYFKHLLLSLLLVRCVKFEKNVVYVNMAGNFMGYEKLRLST